MRGAVAALVQALAGGVEAKGDLVFHYGETDKLLSACLGKPLYMIYALKSFDYGLLNNALAVGNGEELGVKAVSFYGEGGILGQKLLPGESFGAFKKLVKGFCVEAAKLYKDSTAHAEVYIGLSNCCFITGEVHTTVFGLDILHAESFKLVGNRAFKSQKAGDA